MGLSSPLLGNKKAHQLVELCETRRDYSTTAVPLGNIATLYKTAFRLGSSRHTNMVKLVIIARLKKKQTSVPQLPRWQRKPNYTKEMKYQFEFSVSVN